MLTAAHCVNVQLEIFELTHVRLGDWDTLTNPDIEYYSNETLRNDPFIDVPIEEIIVHESYDNVEKYNDIALIRLSQPVNYTQFIRPICLPLDGTLRNRSLAGDTLDVAGWGPYKKD